MQTSIAVVVGLVIGVTQWIKERLALSGRPAEALSFIVGFVAGGGYQLALYPPVTAPDWLGAVVVAVGMALVPSGLYKFASDFRVSG